MNVVDTDILIDFLRGRDPGAEWVEQALRTGPGLATTVVTRFELLAGVRTPQERETVEALLDALVSLPLHDRAAERAAAIRRDLGQGGRGVGMANSLIAGIVLAAGGSLITRNTQHFGRVPELVVQVPS